APPGLLWSRALAILTDRHGPMRLITYAITNWPTAVGGILLCITPMNALYQHWRPSQPCTHGGHPTPTTPRLRKGWLPFTATPKIPLALATSLSVLSWFFHGL